MTINNFVQNIVNDLSENELLLAYGDVKRLLMDEALPEECPLKRLERYVSSQAEAPESILDKTIECVLFRLADGYASHLQSDHEERIEGWKLYCSANRPPVCLVRNASETAMWDYGVFTDDVYGVPLAYFPDESSALSFISSKNYKCVNDGKAVDY